MPHGHNPDDRDAGDLSPAPATFEAEVLALIPALRRYSRSLVRSEADGEDLLQDCVEKALARRGQWRGINLRAWLTAIMTNLYRSGLRQRSRHELVDIDDNAELPAEEKSGDPLEHARLHLALDGLAPESRAILMLVVVEGHSYRDVADMLDIPIGTVMSRLSRARNRLTSLMNADNVVALRRPR